MITQPHIQLRNISKHFGPVAALNDIDLQIERGSVHALVGENGAGKSTLGKIVSGLIRPDVGGEVRVNGQGVHYTSPYEALLDGITIISQEISLAPRLTVLQNVLLGLESHWGGIFLDKPQTRQRFETLLEKSGFALEADTLVSKLSFSEMKQVEILKAMAREAQLIVMDEPTAALPDEETARLLEIIQQLRADGVTIVFVSHFLEEVLAVSDTITVLRDGEHIQTTPAAEQTPESIVTAMLGREMSLTFPPKQYPHLEAPTIFSVQNLSKKGSLSQITFDIRAGEIVGLAGLVGSGRSALGMSIFGAQAIDSGGFEIDGTSVTITSPTQAVRSGVALLPESRKTQGLLMNFDIAANVTLPHLSTVSKRQFIQKRQALAETAQLLQQMDVRPPRPEMAVSSLSGGNQQKVLFGKWLFRHPRLLIVDEPTHGVDVGARRAIYQLITDLAEGGMGILVISSELEEILGLSHRVLVMRQGEIVAEFVENPAENRYLSEDEIMHAAFATG